MTPHKADRKKSSAALGLIVAFLPLGICALTYIPNLSGRSMGLIVVLAVINLIYSYLELSKYYRSTPALRSSDGKSGESDR
jgi:ABC-type siderophore export system fused ATPase/permease subunit